MDPPVEGIEWETLGFSQSKSDFMIKTRWTREQGTWEELQCVPYGPFDVEPGAGALNYGFTIIEGVKAFRWADGSAKLFRPDRNACRARQGAERLAMPPVEEEMFISALKACVAANARFLPPHRRGALYLRPILFAAGAKLAGVPDEFIFCVFCSPVGNYFGSSEGIRLLISSKYNRSAVGGVGWIKAAGNYAPTFLAKREAKEKGFDEVVYLDSRSSTNLEEASAANIFVVVDGVLHTPDTGNGTILSGVIRETLIDIARKDFGMEVIDGEPVPASLLAEADEAFLCGTGASITPVACVAWDNASDQPSATKSFKVIETLKIALEDIQFGSRAAPGDWHVDVTPEDKLA